MIPIPDKPCDVTDCKRPMFMGFEAFNIKKRVCEYHYKRHCNDNDDFSLLTEFKVPKLGLNVDKFGFPVARDEKEMLAALGTHHEVEKEEKKEKGLEKLKEWKETHKDAPKKFKPKQAKPRPESQSELDDIAAMIAKGE